MVTFIQLLILGTLIGLWIKSSRDKEKARCDEIIASNKAMKDAGEIRTAAYDKRIKELNQKLENIRNGGDYSKWISK